MVSIRLLGGGRMVSTPNALWGLEHQAAHAGDGALEEAPAPQVVQAASLMRSLWIGNAEARLARRLARGSQQGGRVNKGPVNKLLIRLAS